LQKAKIFLTYQLFKFFNKAFSIKYSKTQMNLAQDISKALLSNESDIPDIPQMQMILKIQTKG